MARALQHSPEPKNQEGIKQRIQELEAELGGLKEALFNAEQAENGVVPTSWEIDDRIYTLGCLAADMAHEINNPLLVLVGYLGKLDQRLANSPLKEDPQILKALERVRKMSWRIQTIVEGVLKYSRDEHDTFEPLKVDLLQVVADTSLLIDYRFRAASIKFINSCPPGPFWIKAVASQISQVVLNLLVNAHQAVEAHQEPWVELLVSQEADQVILKVRDAGQGLPPEVAARIFDRGFTTKKAGQGTGLGLPLSQAIAKRHGGSLAVDTTDTNTCFVLKLPAAT